jgi:uncharacterized protein YndB with AHSA1/START domain
MDRIETQLAIHADPDRVFEEITHPQNIPLYAPGIEEARQRPPEAPEAAGNLLDLVTRSGDQLEGEIIDRQANKIWAVEDENGTVARWRLEEGDDGTLATFVLEGDFDPEKERELRSEMRAKIARLVLDLEQAGDEP